MSDFFNSKIFKLLDDLYREKGNPSLLSSCKYLYSEAIKENPEITVKDVKKFLKSKDAHTLMVEKPKRFCRRKFMFPKPGHTLCGDIAYLNEFKQGSYKYLLFMMDGFSRYLWISPIKSLKQKDVLPPLENVLKNSIYDIEYFFSDQGIEFYNKGAKKLFKKYRIHQYHTNSEIKCGIIERSIKTIKRKLSKYIIEFNEDFMTSLDTIVSSYNLSAHRGLMDECPLDVYLLTDVEQIHKFTLSINRFHFKRSHSLANKLALGTVVRLSSLKKLFVRAIYMQNTQETFIVSKVLNTIPTTYKIKDTSGNEIQGSFYKEELTPIVHRNSYPVKVLKKRRRGKNLEYLVNWIGYPHCEPEWISKNQLKRM